MRTSLLKVVSLIAIATASVFLFVNIGQTAGSPLIISEFRFRGPNGANDEFVEIYNTSDTEHVVTSSDGSAGYALAAADGVIRFVIPNGTVIQPGGHYLGVNTIAYSLSLSPAGNGTTATGDATFTTDLPDNTGVALFNNATPANFTLANRFDAVGSTNVANTLYREGTGFSPLIPFSIDHSFVRKVPTSGSGAGLPVDSDDNNADFLFVDTNGTSAGAGQRLGAPGPENMSGPTTVGTNIGNARLDPAQADADSPNVNRDFTSDPPNNSTFGTISIRRTFTNNTETNITRLRFRIFDISTFPSPSSIADLRPRTSVDTNVTLTDTSTVLVRGTVLEQPPSQPNGGGFNSAMSAGNVSAATPLAPGESINLQFLMGIQQTGCYKFALVAESLPGAGSEVIVISGDTQGGTGTCGAPTPTPGGTSLVISEFRLRGPNGAADEFVEIYNNSDDAVNVAASDGSGGYALAASDGIIRFVIPNGTIIPGRGHYLGVNVSGYSIASYPAGNGSTATGDATFNTNINDNAGIALFKTTNSGNFNVANRLDAAGSTAESNTLYREGAGYPSIVPFSIDASFTRKIPATGGGAGLPQDTGDNNADFLFVDTNGTSAGAGQRLGAPGPENMSGPRTRGTDISHAVLDAAQAATDSPNVARDFTSDPPNNSTFGTLSIRRTFTNNTGGNITRLRFRVIDLSTFPAPSGTADLRPRTSGDINISLTGGGTALVNGTTLEQPPIQVNGGGFNSSLSAGSVTPGQPLLSGGSINVQFLMGLQQTGCYRLAIITESLPAGGSSVFLISGNTEGGAGSCGDPTPTPTPTPDPSPSPSPSPTASPTPTPTPGGTTLIISEFRLRGPNGANDEFVEIYNNGNSGINVGTTDGSTGYALAASDGTTRFIIPNGTIIPAKGHYLAVNNIGYSLSAYPAGNGTLAIGDDAFSTNIPDNAGIALFKTANPANFNLANRLDAVGTTSTPDPLYREGAGLPPLIPFSIDYSWYRTIPSTGSGAGLPKDSNDNSADFLFVDTNGTSAGGGQRLGAPGPEGLTSPGHLGNGSGVGISLVDPGVGANASPNFVRDFTSDPANNSTFGTMSVRRKFTNNTGTPISRLRLRIIDLTTFPAPSGTADLRPRTSGTIAVALSGGGLTTVNGTQLEQPPSQPNGGGFNSSMSTNTVLLGAPLADGSSINLQLLFGVQQDGNANFCAVIETLPFSTSSVLCFSNDTTPPTLTSALAITSLSPPNSNLVNVGLSASANEPATFSVNVFGDEDDQTPTSNSPFTVHSPDAKNIAVGTLRLRSERMDSGDGRVYLVVVTATDTAGNSSKACHTVTVARNKNGTHAAQAAAAKSFCEANNGAAPPGYFVIGDGPIIGPKQ